MSSQKTMVRLGAIGSSVVVALLSSAAAAFGQGNQIGQQAALPGAQCLTDQQRENNAKLKALNRSTTKEDPVWVFDPAYFVGTWTLDWDGPETIVGADLSGTLTIAHVEGCYYEGTLKAMDGKTPYSAKIQITTDPSRSWVTWVENDSRGFTVVRSGFIGTDLGGYFTHFWEYAPVFTYKGKKVRMFGNTFLASPGAFRVRAQVSTDGGPYVNMGAIWFRKDAAQAQGGRKP